MTLPEICIHERLGMLTRSRHGFDQHDDHLWRWLNHHLRIWTDNHPVRVIMPPFQPPCPDNR